MKKRTLPSDLAGLAGWLALTFAAAAAGSAATIAAGEFYALLARPAWAPPAWLFGPAWGVLYLMMALAAWLAWRKSGLGAAPAAFGLFLAQLAANALWSWFFFAWRSGSAAFAWIILLWCLIAACARSFLRLDRAAAALLLPYLAWVTYAAALNWATWRLNPSLLG